jgi:hypothetical protein
LLTGTLELSAPLPSPTRCCWLSHFGDAWVPLLPCQVRIGCRLWWERSLWGQARVCGQTFWITSLEEGVFIYAGRKSYLNLLPTYSNIQKLRITRSGWLVSSARFIGSFHRTDTGTRTHLICGYAHALDLEWALASALSLLHITFLCQPQLVLSTLAPVFTPLLPLPTSLKHWDVYALTSQLLSTWPRRKPETDKTLRQRQKISAEIFFEIIVVINFLFQYKLRPKKVLFFVRKINCETNKISHVNLW